MSFFKSNLESNFIGSLTSGAQQRFSDLKNMMKSIDEVSVEPSTSSSLADGSAKWVKDVSIYDRSGNQLVYTGFAVMNDSEEYIPNGPGTMLYPNDSVYEGEFEDGKRTGHGKLKFLTVEVGSQRSTDVSKRDKDCPFIVCNWDFDIPREEKPCRISYSNRDQYAGFFTVSYNTTPVTPTTSFSMFRIGSSSNVKTIPPPHYYELRDFVRQREGELHCGDSGDKYFGNWNSDMRDGYGIHVSGTTAERYYGQWKNDKYDGMGLLLYKDGTIYSGPWIEGKRSDKIITPQKKKGIPTTGTVYFPNGDTLEGYWNGLQVNNATYSKGNLSKCSLLVLHQMKSCIASELRELRDYDYNFPTVFKWKHYYNCNLQDWEAQKQNVVQSAKLSMNTKESFVLLVERMLNNKDGFLHRFVEYFVISFHGCYKTKNLNPRSKLTTPSILLPHAVDDVKAVSNLLWEKCAEFFKNDVLKGDVDKYAQLDTCLRELIADHIQQKVYDTLINLYEKAFEDEQVMYEAKMKPLENDSISSFGVEEMFQPLPNDSSDTSTSSASSVPSTSQSSIAETTNVEMMSPAQLVMHVQQQRQQQSDVMVSIGASGALSPTTLRHSTETNGSLKDNSGAGTTSTTATSMPYSDCVKLLESLTEQHSASAKIGVLKSVRDRILNKMFDYRKLYRKAKYPHKSEEEDDWQPGADDITPIYNCVWSKAKLNHYAHFRFIDEFKDRRFEVDEVLHTITFYGGFLDMAIELDPYSRNEKGVLIPPGVISNSIEDYLYLLKQNNRGRSELSFHWLPILLASIGLEIGSNRQLVTYDANTQQELSTQLFLPPSVFCGAANMQVAKQIFESAKLVGFTIDIVPFSAVASTYKATAEGTSSDGDGAASDSAPQASSSDASTVASTSKSAADAESVIAVATFTKIYPPHIYSTLSMLLTRFIRVEL